MVETKVVVIMEIIMAAIMVAEMMMEVMDKKTLEEVIANFI